jgi:hypothetical protein
MHDVAKRAELDDEDSLDGCGGVSHA